jgi:hypothetical protein
VPTTLGEWGFSPSVVVATNNPRLCKNQFAASSDSNSLRHKVQCFVDAGSQTRNLRLDSLVTDCKIYNSDNGVLQRLVQQEGHQALRWVWPGTQRRLTLHPCTVTDMHALKEFNIFLTHQLQAV